MLVGKLQFPGLESQLPKTAAVTRYVFNKPHPEDKLNVDIVKRIIWIWQFTAVKTEAPAADFLRCQRFLLYSPPKIKSFLYSSYLQQGSFSQNGINEVSWITWNIMDWRRKHSTTKRKPPFIGQGWLGGANGWHCREIGQKKPTEKLSDKEVRPMSIFATIYNPMSTDKPKVIMLFTCDRRQMEGFALITLPSCKIPGQCFYASNASSQLWLRVNVVRTSVQFLWMRFLQIGTKVNFRPQQWTG